MNEILPRCHFEPREESCPGGFVTMVEAWFRLPCHSEDLAEESVFMRKTYYTYIATNPKRTVLYTGVTNDLERRMHEHRSKSLSGFTAKYNVTILIWYDTFSSPVEAIAAEKKIKGWNRKKKLALIQELNPTFKELL